MTSGSGTTIWFAPQGFQASFVTVQYRVDGGQSQNYFLSYDSADRRWELPVQVSAGAVVTYFFNYQPSTQTSQITTPSYTWNAV
ncbi:hypothetical protein OHB11_38505 [Streptomyces zaomyceticus]|uniref:CBM56 domain-containing protein n=1 Tax=Streptomyces zaomyceticus TaxID=68286 RepID=A0ABZ1LMN4_9ACTN